jgi:predicted PurR-regulated permease PerM
VGLWLLVFREAPVQAIALVSIGFFLNTVYISTYLRPKIAAEKSKVLNFYWMLVGLVTGVYTFGLVGVLLGPMVIGLLKAILDTITASSSWRMLEEEDAVRPGPVTAEPA